MEFLTNTNFLAYLVAYLIGAIPFGLVLAKVFANVDIKSAGSGGIGATNVLRVVKEKDPKLAKKLGIATLLLDALKGMLPILIAKFLGFDENVLWGMAFVAVVGHCYSPYLNFEGGKGVATGVGVVAALLPLEAIIGLLFWAIVAKTLKISSISSLIGLLSAITASFFLHPGISQEIGSQAPLLLIGFIIFYKHIPNIVRLLKGEEKKVA